MSLGLFSVPFSFLFFASNGLRWVYEFYAINLFCSSAHPSPHLRILTRCFVCLPTRTASIHIRPFSLPISSRVRYGRHDHDLQVTTTLHLFRIHIPGIYTPHSYPLALYPYISLSPAHAICYPTLRLHLLASSRYQLIYDNWSSSIYIYIPTVMMTPGLSFRWCDYRAHYVHG